MIRRVSGSRLEYYLGLQYPFIAQVDPDGGYFVTFPDLQGCMTGADTIDELPAMIEEGRTLWIEGEYEDGHWIPLPTLWDPDDDDYSGKFNVRLPKSLHRALAEAAGRDGVSLNQHVLALLARGEVEKRMTKPTSAGDKPRATHRVADERAPYDATAAPRRSARSGSAKASPPKKPARRSTKR